jgi:cell division protein FtsB
VLLAVVPALVLGLLTASAIWGDSGLLVRHELRARLQRASDELADLDRENQRIVHELVSMERDPVVVERVVAEELGWARDGATVYRFDP